MARGEKERARSRAQVSRQELAPRMKKKKERRVHCASSRLRTSPRDVARARGHDAGHIHRASDCQDTEESEQTEQGQRRKRERKQQQVEHANGVLPMPQCGPPPFNEHFEPPRYPRIAPLARARSGATATSTPGTRNAPAASTSAMAPACATKPRKAPLIQ